MEETNEPKAKRPRVVVVDEERRLYTEDCGDFLHEKFALWGGDVELQTLQQSNGATGFALFIRSSEDDEDASFKMGSPQVARHFAHWFLCRTFRPNGPPTHASGPFSYTDFPGVEDLPALLFINQESGLANAVLSSADEDLDSLEQKLQFLLDKVKLEKKKMDTKQARPDVEPPPYYQFSE
jgi:hypothetical protein